MLPFLHVYIFCKQIIHFLVSIIFLPTEKVFRGDNTGVSLKLWLLAHMFLPRQSFFSGGTRQNWVLEPFFSQGVPSLSDLLSRYDRLLTLPPPPPPLPQTTGLGSFFLAVIGNLWGDVVELRPPLRPLDVPATRECHSIIWDRTWETAFPLEIRSVLQQMN